MNLLSFFKTKKTKPSRGRLGTYDIQNIRGGWQEVEQLIELGKPSQMKQAIIKADKIVDGALKKISIGDTMGERLKNAKDLFSNYEIYQGLWDAHKVRNALVHEADYEPTRVVATEAIDKFKTALEDIGTTFPSFRT